MDRVVDIASERSSIVVRSGCLLLQREDGTTSSVALCDVSAIIVTARDADLTAGVLRAAAEAGCALVVADDAFRPLAVLLPMVSHSTQSERFSRQVALGAPRKKRLWQSIVRAKISAQAAVLDERNGSAAGLDRMIARVRSGDTGNVEAQAARRYWGALVQDPEFRRDPERPGLNRWLNYTYAVVRATVARALCATGLHPSLGLHHHNRYDPFCLADDLMEPLRPHADRSVLFVRESLSDPGELDRTTKSALVETVTGNVRIDGEDRTLADACGIMASSLAQCIVGERALPILPGGYR